MSNTNQCSCSTTYTRTYNRALSDSECNSRCKAAGYDKGVSNGKTGTWSGTGSTCREADSAATSNFNNNSSYSTYCDCSDNPEPVKTWSAEAYTTNQGQGPGSLCPDTKGSLRYTNNCGTTKSITVTVRCAGSSVTNTYNVDVPTGQSEKALTFPSAPTSGGTTCPCSNVSMTGSGNGTC